MKKLLVGTLALSLVTTWGIAQNDFYIGVGTAMEFIDNDYVADTGMAIELKVGKVFDNNFGIEGKFTKTTVSAEDSKYLRNTELDFSTYSIWGTYNHKLMPDLVVTPKIGYMKINGEFSTPGMIWFIDADDSRVVYGVDLKKSLPTYDLTLYSGFTLMASDFNHFSFGVEKTF